MIKIDPTSPLHPPEFAVADAAAMKALLTGTASSHQQQRAINWILYSASCVNDLSFRQDPYLTAFAEGKRFVGLMIVDLCKQDLELLKKKQTRYDNE